MAVPFTIEGFDEYLRDESKFTGHASGVARPASEEQVAGLVRLAAKERVPLTVVSGKTSLTGACVPRGGLLVDVKNLDYVERGDASIVGPGAVLADYRQVVTSLGLFYPPDPTSEQSCTIGGTVACNASGPLSYSYGPTRDHVRGLRVVMPSGSILDVERGAITSSRGTFLIPAEMLDPRPASDPVIPAPRIPRPSWRICKNSAGLHYADPMDIVDLFIGSEGILGIIVQVRTILRRARNPFFSLLLYLPSREMTVDLVTLLDNVRRRTAGEDISVRTGLQGPLRATNGLEELLGDGRSGLISPSCMEWLGSSVGGLLPGRRGARLMESYGCLYVEQEYGPDSDPFSAASHWADLTDLINLAAHGSGSSVEAEVAIDASQIRRIQDDRKKVPERLNEMISPGCVKIGLDFAVPRGNLCRLMELYDDMLPLGSSYVFGHIGNSHLHANIIARDGDEEARYRSLYLDIAQQVCAMGGSVSGEHGIGKLKHEALRLMIGQEGLDQIAAVKRALDPSWLLNRGNMLAAG